MADWIMMAERGVLLTVKAVPNSSKQQLILRDDQLKVYVQAPAIDNKANEQIIKYLASFFSIKKRDVQILRGERSKQKQILLVNQSVEQIKRIIDEVSYGEC